MEQQNNPTEYKFDLRFLLQAARRWSKYILMVTIVAAISSTVYALLLKNYYPAKCVVLVYNANALNPASLFLKNPYGSDILGSTVISAGDAQDYGRVSAIMESKDVSDALIKEFNLYAKYDIDTTDKDAYTQVVRALGDYTNIVRTDKNMLEINTEDQDALIAAKMANRYAELANEKAAQLFRNDILKHAALYKERYEAKLKEVKQLRDSVNSAEVRKGDVGGRLYMQKMLESESAFLAQLKTAYEITQAGAEKKN